MEYCRTDLTLGWMFTSRVIANKSLGSRKFTESDGRNGVRTSIGTLNFTSTLFVFQSELNCSKDIFRNRKSSPYIIKALASQMVEIAAIMVRKSFYWLEQTFKDINPDLCSRGEICGCHPRN